jgi:hypothetical protein
MEPTGEGPGKAIPSCPFVYAMHTYRCSNSGMIALETFWGVEEWILLCGFVAVFGGSYPDLI